MRVSWSVLVMWEMAGRPFVLEGRAGEEIVVERAKAGSDRLREVGLKVVECSWVSIAVEGALKVVAVWALVVQLLVRRVGRRWWW